MKRDHIVFLNITIPKFYKWKLLIKYKYQKHKYSYTSGKVFIPWIKTGIWEPATFLTPNIASFKYFKSSPDPAPPTTNPITNQSLVIRIN
jgi:hypothetical protein